MEVHTAFGRRREEMADQPEPDYRDPDDVLELIDTRGALPKVIIERNGRALDTALGAGKLPPEIRNIGRELPAAGDTAPVKKPARRWLRRS
jgi:hypothetical protein